MIAQQPKPNPNLHEITFALRVFLDGAQSLELFLHPLATGDDIPLHWMTELAFQINDKAPRDYTYLRGVAAAMNAVLGSYCILDPEYARRLDEGDPSLGYEPASAVLGATPDGAVLYVYGEYPRLAVGYAHDLFGKNGNNRWEGQYNWLPEDTLMHVSTLAKREQLEMADFFLDEEFPEGRPAPLRGITQVIHRNVNRLLPHARFTRWND